MSEIVVGDDVQRYYIVLAYIRSLLEYDLIDWDNWYELWCCTGDNYKTLNNRNNYKMIRNEK